MAKAKKFSVIIPTYTGASTVAQCFESMLTQKQRSSSYEIIVVIDGINKELAEICASYEKKFQKRSIQFSIHQLHKNKGRFVARQEGAELAGTKQLLFLDDRITFAKDYFQILSDLKKKVVIPNVIEAESPNFISRCLYLLRKRVYGEDKFGEKFQSHYINQANFESSPKGTTSLWVDKDIFLRACKKLEKEASNNKYTNEDTKLFKIIIDNGDEIYRSSDAVIYYHPRTKIMDEIEHIYSRGPRFVDYYINPRTRFFPLLIAVLLVSIGFLGTIILWPALLIDSLLISFGVLVAFATISMMKLGDFPILLFGLPVIFIAFSLGLYKGLIIFISSKLSRIYAKK